MATAGTHARGWNGPSRRRLPRYRVQVPLDVTVLRSGVPDTVPGRSVNLGERGVAAVLAGEFRDGEAVGLELRLPLAPDTLRTRALVRYQDRLRCGLEFVGLSAKQQAAIRDWAEKSKAEAESVMGEPIGSQTLINRAEEVGGVEGASSTGSGTPKESEHGVGWTVMLLAGAILLVLFWWRWNRGWEELESGLSRQEQVSTVRPQVQVPAAEMERLLIHRVDPEYPAAARKMGLEGVIALDVVVGRDGSVVDVRPLNGPDILARAAVEALRWWKFEPYRVNGQPVVVGTRMAVEFKP
jgi:TonB family protein